MIIETNPLIKSERQARLPARPEPLLLNVNETAIVVVDMQNAYSSKNGYLDHAGITVDSAPAIASISKILEVARSGGMTIVFFQNGWDKDYIEAGAAGSPNWYKSNALKTMRRKPELSGQLLSKGGWDYALIDELTPLPGEIVVPKTRYSGMFNTGFDSMMRSRGIRNLVFCGIATNVCVESTLRDAFHLEYFCILIEDAASASGPDYMQKASVHNIESFFGWVSNTADFCRSFSQVPPAKA